ncbi:MAG: hypothetical protein HY823_04630 [Acidobacteria bacterium]|nr:hypothetical protein [Acidobacteriota bacterium]
MRPAALFPHQNPRGPRPRNPLARVLPFLFCLPCLGAGPLKVVSVAAPAINCIFNPDCRVVVKDSTSAIPVGDGKGFLQSRTFRGKAGAPGQGLFAVEYRIDLRNCQSQAGGVDSISTVTVDAGTVVGTLDYDKDGSPDEVFVVTQGGLGSLGPTSAVQDSAGRITFSFNPPVKAGTLLAPGQSSFFFGFASPVPPASSTATLQDDDGILHPVAARSPMTQAPDLTAWLNAHPAVAGAIKWQFRQENYNSLFSPPTDASKVAWPAWSQAQKDELLQAYLDTFAWFAQGGIQAPMDPGGLTDKPLNRDSWLSVDTTCREYVGKDYMWRLYLGHVAFSLYLELTQQVPWSVTTYDAESLRTLFDSSSMAWNYGLTIDISTECYSMGVDPWHIPAKVGNNLPFTAFAPPRWTFPWLRQSGLIGETRLDSICRVLDWMRFNMEHVLDAGGYAWYEGVWGYRGYPPLSAVVNGTVDSHYPQYGSRHWTEGCHGSVGFLCEVLRALNIPVRPVWVLGPVLTSGHEQACFQSEKLYLGHGDDPYNTNVKNTPAPIRSLLLDEATYKLWFTTDLSSNVPYSSAAWSNVSRAATEFH